MNHGPVEKSVVEIRKMGEASGPEGSRLKVFLAQHTADLSGSTISGQLVARGFRRAGWQVEAVFGAEGPGRARYDELGCSTSILPYKSWLRGGNAFHSFRQMIGEIAHSRTFASRMRETKPDLVYVNTIVGLSAAVAARHLKIPCVWHIRELFDDVGGEMRIPALGGKALVRRIISVCADHIVLISEAVRDNFLGSQRKDRFSIVPNAVDDRFFELTATQAECRHLFDLPTEGPIVGVPGTLRPMKGHEFFLTAAAQVARQVSSCRFVITGNGEAQYVDRLQRRVDDLGLSACVRFLGSIDRMPEFYRACDAICIPSRAEPFGRTVIEAFAVGTPVVASAVGGILESVEHDVTGLLVTYDDDSALARAILSLLNSQSLGQQLAFAARRQALAQNSATAYHARINAIVEATLAERQPRAVESST